MRTYSRGLKIASTITLAFFLWSFGPIYAAVAWAATSGPQSTVNGQQPKSRNARTADSRQTTDVRLPGAGERFEKALESIRENIGKAEGKESKNQNITAEVAEVKAKRAEIDSLDVDLKKEFSATEKKLKDAKLPKEILDRHYKFVKHYEDNLKELKSNLDAVGKYTADSKQGKEAIRKAKQHLEKTKTPSKHVPLDPNKLPHRMVKGKERTPRLKKEEFERDFPPQRHKGTKTADSNLGADERGLSRIFNSALRNPGFAIQQRPILLASNAPASDMPFDLPRPLEERIDVRGGFDSAFVFSDHIVNHESGILNLAQAAPVDAPTADDLSETPEVQFTSELRQTATLLENNPVQFYEFVRNLFSYDPYYGSVKGSQSTLLLQSGNDFDQASALIALFRVSGIPARYAYGTVEIPIEKVMKWLGGITDPRTAGLVLASNGIPAKLMITGGAIKSVQLEHVWVEAYIPYANYRGKINDPTAPKTWIPLDPSFKLIETNPDNIDLADAQQFDIDNYLTNYLQTIKPTTPAKDYLKTTMGYVKNNILGKSFYDLIVSDAITEKTLGLLPDTLPYPVKVNGAKFTAIPESFRHLITLELSGPNTNEIVLNYASSWAMLLHNRFSLSYMPATAVDEQIIASYGGIYSAPPYLIRVKPNLLLEGNTVAEGNPIGMGEEIVCKMSFYGPQGVLDNIVTNNLTAGATYVISLGSGYTTERIISYRGEKLRAAAAAGKTGDPTLGEYLNLLSLYYLQDLDSSRKMISKSMRLLDTNRMAELMVGIDLGVSHVFSIPRAVDIRGLLIDVDYNIATPIDIDGNQSKVRRFQILTGMTSSALEHTVFETITGIESISTIKALQVASEQGIPIHWIDASNISTKLPLLQLSNEVKTDIQNAVNTGKVVTVSERNVQLNNWYGIGYAVLDSSGAGAYLISNGISGGSLTGVIAELKYLLASGDINADQANTILTNGKVLIWFKRPVVGGMITARFNTPRSYGPHSALDIAIENWSPVMAVADGKVIEAQYQDEAGYYLKIDHGLGFVTLYAHNCMMLVHVGMDVKEGQTVALSGNTGRVDSEHIDVHGPNFFTCGYNAGQYWGSHVHFDIRKDGVKIDPEKYLGIIGENY